MPPAMPTVHPARRGICLDILLHVPWLSFATNGESCIGSAARNHLQNPANSDILASLSLGDSRIRPAQAGLRIVT
jgi:hypothetical protein